MMCFHTSKNTTEKEQKNKYGTNSPQLFLKHFTVNRYRGAKNHFVLYFTSMCIYHCITKNVFVLK